MSWIDDPFVSKSDEGDDPFLEPEFPSPHRAAEPEPSDPLRSNSDGTQKQNPFVPGPFDGRSGGGAPADPTDGGSDRGKRGDPFGRVTVGEASRTARTTHRTRQFIRGSKTRLEAPSLVRHRLWLAAGVLLLTGLTAFAVTFPWGGDGGPRVAQPAQDAGTDADAATPGPSGPGAESSAATPGAGETPDPETLGNSAGESAPATLLGCDDQSGLDPHGLISFGQGLDRRSFCGEETWQVFVCATRESDRTERVTYIDEVLGEAAAWFDWASGGQYDIDFSAGDDTSVVSGGNASFEDCFEKVRATDWSESRSGAVVLLDEAALDVSQNYAGVGTCGYIREADSGVFGDSQRMVGIAVHAPGEQAALAVHELGHAQCWPHSFSGKTDSEYDNPLDVVSSDSWPVGTLAVNRYASGWIHPDQVRVHRDSSAEYDLSTCCGGGVQMLALLPAGASAPKAGLHRRWWHLEVRDPRDRWERGLADAGVGERVGVSVHWIENSSGDDNERRQAQVGDEAGVVGNRPVLFGPLSVSGSEFCLHSDIPTSFADCEADHEWRIEVGASQHGDLNLTVSPGS